MNEKEFQDYVLEECKRQWKDNQEEIYGPWEKQTAEEQQEYCEDMYKYLKELFKFIKQNDPSVKNNYELFLMPGVKAIIYYRISRYFYLRKHYFISRLILEKCKRKTK